MKNIPYKFRNNFFRKFKIKKVIISIIVMIVVIILFPHFFRNTYIVTIVNKREIIQGNVHSYLIYTQLEDGSVRVFKDTNSLLEFKMHSDNLYWALAINRKYEVKAYGLNVPLLSSYENITKVKGEK